MRASLLCLLAVVAAASADNASRAAASFVTNFKQSLRELSTFNLSKRDSEVYDALLLGALMKLATIHNKPGQVSQALVNKDYQLVTRALSENFPEHKKKIQKLSLKNKKFAANQTVKKKKLGIFFLLGYLPIIITQYFFVSSS